MAVRAYKIFILVITVAFIIIFSSPPAFAPAAVATGTATVYKIIINRFELYNGTSWVIVADSASTTIDIASANAGGKAGDFFAGLSVPDGTYTQVRVTPSGTFIIKGSASYLGTTYYTTASNNDSGGGTVSTTGPAAECTLTLSVTSTEQTMPSSITVVNGKASHKVRVSFNVSGALGLYTAGPSYEFYPEIPVVTMALIAN